MGNTKLTSKSRAQVTAAQMPGLLRGTNSVNESDLQPKHLRMPRLAQQCPRVEAPAHSTSNV